MDKCILASHNVGKLRELQATLAPLSLTLIPQSDYGVEECDEPGETFIENAIIKARHACLQTGLPAIADDSGVVVDALHGAPGVRSARYSGLGAEANIEKLLQALHGVPESDRTARFACVIVFMRNASDPLPIVCQGVWEGRVLTEIRGAGGFGYDPVFFIPSQGCSAAELPFEQKNQLSHRAKALHLLMKQLREEVTL